MTILAHTTPIKSSYTKPCTRTINGVSAAQKQNCNNSDEYLGKIQLDDSVRIEFNVGRWCDDCILSEQQVGGNTYHVTISGKGNEEKVEFMKLTRPSLEIPDHNTPRVTAGHHHHSTTFFNKVQRQGYNAIATMTGPCWSGWTWANSISLRELNKQALLNEPTKLFLSALPCHERTVTQDDKVREYEVMCTLTLTLPFCYCIKSIVPEVSLHNFQQMTFKYL
jgi:hypothetical protein